MAWGGPLPTPQPPRLSRSQPWPGDTASAPCSGGSSIILGGERSTPIWFLAKQPVFQPILKLASARLMRQDLEPGEYLATVTAFDLAGKTTTRATSVWVRPRDSLAEPSPIASSTGCSVDDTHSPPSVGDHSQRIQLESGQTFGLPLALDHVDTPYVRYVLDVASGGSVLHRFIGPDDVEPQPNLASATGLTSTTIEIRRSGQYLLELDAPGDAVSAGVDVTLVWSVPSVGRQPPELLDLDNAPQLVNKLQEAGYHRARLTIPANEALSITLDYPHGHSYWVSYRIETEPGAETPMNFGLLGPDGGATKRRDAVPVLRGRHRHPRWRKHRNGPRQSQRQHTSHHPGTGSMSNRYRDVPTSQTPVKNASMAAGNHFPTDAHLALGHVSLQQRKRCRAQLSEALPCQRAAHEQDLKSVPVAGRDRPHGHPQVATVAPFRRSARPSSKKGG